ncbi:MAG TPA: hypothetical protein VFW49_14530, partial [Fluviicoccus sp.]|nr:hypothetical protein [Fluviicoccus sp.]
AAGALSSQLVKNLRRLPPVRPLFDELKIKPRNRFKEGLFMARGRQARLDRGNHLPQAWLRAADGRGLWSDDVMGEQWTLIGFGVDPSRALSPAQRAAWEDAGGACLHLRHRGQAGASGWEDITGQLVPEMAPVGWVAVVRPDRVIVHDGPAEVIDGLVVESLALLAGRR